MKKINSILLALVFAFGIFAGLPVTARAAGETDVTFTAAQTGGASNVTDSKSILLTFDQAVTGLTADKITVTNGTGAAVKGPLSGSGTSYQIYLSGVDAQGDVSVSIGDFGAFHVITPPQTVAVYRNVDPMPRKTVYIVDNTVPEDYPGHTYRWSSMGPAVQTLGDGDTIDFSLVTAPGVFGRVSVLTGASITVRGNGMTALPVEIVVAADLTLDHFLSYLTTASGKNVTIGLPVGKTTATLTIIGPCELTNTMSASDALHTDATHLTINGDRLALNAARGIYMTDGVMWQGSTLTVNNEIIATGSQNEGAGLYFSATTANRSIVVNGSGSLSLSSTGSNGHGLSVYSSNTSVNLSFTGLTGLDLSGSGTGSGIRVTAIGTNTVTFNRSLPTIVTGGDTGHGLSYAQNAGNQNLNNNGAPVTFEAGGTSGSGIYSNGSLTVGGTGTIAAVGAGGGDGIRLPAGSGLLLNGNANVTAEGGATGPALTISGAGKVSFADQNQVLTLTNNAAAETVPLTRIAASGYLWSVTGDGSLTTGAAAEQNVTATVQAGPAKTAVIRLVTGATPPAITTGSLPDGTVGALYNQTLTATGTAPITWSVISGTLPPGLSLNDSTGVIYGAPTATGVYNFSVKAANGTAPDATKAFALTILPQTYAVTVVSAGTGATGSGSYAAGTAVTIRAGTAPAGMQFDHWTASPGVTFANANSGVTTFTMPASAVTVTASFEPVPATVTGVTVNPSTATVQKGTTYQFGATVTGTNDPPQSVMWSVLGGDGSSSITASGGILTVGSTETAGAVLTVTANSLFDFGKYDTATVTVSDNAPPTPTVTTVTVNPAAITLNPGDSYTFGAVVSGTNNPSQGVIWTLTGGAAGTTMGANTGALTIAVGETASTLTVRATSTLDNTKSGAAVVTVAVPQQAFVPVTNITGLPSAATAGTPLPLSGTVVPAGATNQTITWSIVSAGSTGATISGNALSATAAGTVTVRATVTNGLTAATDYTQDFSVTVSAAPVNVFTITASAVGNGYISPSGNVSVTLGANQTFTMIPMSGSYYLSGLTVDGSSVAIQSSYTFSNVTANHTIAATFSPYSNNPGGGSYTPTPAPAIPGGSTVTTPAGQPPVAGPGGSITLPGGGTVNTPGGEKVTAPPGSSIDKEGNITVGTGGGKVEHGGVTITVPGGTVVTPGGTVSFPSGSGGGTVTDKSGHTYKAAEDAVIIFDEDTPLGYFIDIANPFTDVKSGDWFYGDVLFAYSHGLMNGTAADKFSSGTNLTRAMIVTVLYRTAGNPSVSGQANPFGDVAAGQYYTDAVIWAAANGIVSGIGGGKYNPDAPISRQDLAVILYRYAVATGAKLPVTRQNNGFKDEADIASYAKEAIDAFFKAGIVSGKPGNIFDPQGTATRAEVAAMLHRFLEAIGK